MNEIKNVNSSRVMDRRTICEVHREIYDVLETMEQTSEVKSIIQKLEEAYIMAKKMDKKLRQYKFDYDDGWWEMQSKEVMKEKINTREKR